MSEVRRICGNCGAAVALDGQYCAACGYDFENALPASTNVQLPIALGKAALPMLVGAAGLALRAGWKLAQSEWAKETVRNFMDMAFNRPAPRDHNRNINVQRAAETTPAPQQPPATSRGRRTIHIRSSWAVGDANGVWRQGTSEQTIEIEE